MQLHYPDYYPDFQCTASACGDNCCIGWEIDIDRDTHSRYMAQPGAFGRRLRGSISSGAPPHFLLQNERCPFLNDRNLCDIVITLGERALCEICTQHPRFHEWFGNRKESGIGLCCEAAARLILQDPRPVTFLSMEIDEPSAPDFPEEALFLALRPARDMLLSLLQNRSHTIGQRLGAALVFASHLQDCLDGGDPVRAVSAFIEICRGEPDRFFHQALESEGGDALGLWDRLFSLFLTLEPINPDWPGRLARIKSGLPDLLRVRQDFLRAYRPRIYEYEHLAVYFVYRYMLKSVFDGDVLAKIKLMAASVLLLSVLDTARWRETNAFSLDDRVQIAKDYSKEMEYCEENLFRFQDESWQSDFLSVESLLALSKNLS